MFPSPIFWNEILTLPRRGRYFALRVLYTGLLFVLLFMCYESYSRTYVYYGNRANPISQGAQIASSFFYAFAVTQFLAILAVTPALIAGVVASERERKTLEYLFTTDLNDTEIVLGKLGARLLHLLSFLLAGVPILSLAMLFGGIPGDVILDNLGIAIATLFSIAAWSLASSVVSRKSRDAITLSYLTLAVFLLVPLLLSLFQMNPNWTWYGTYFFWNEWLVAANPLPLMFYYLPNEMATGLVTLDERTRTYVGAHAIVTVLALIYAVYNLRRWHVRLQSAGGEGTSTRSLFVRGLRPVGDWPMLWKELFAEGARARMTIWRGLMILLLALAVVVPTLIALYFALDLNSAYPAYRAEQEYRGFAATMGGACMVGLILMIAARAACSMTREKENDSWISLLATPLQGTEIIVAKILGSIYAFRWAILLAAGIYATPLLFHLGNVFYLVMFVFNGAILTYFFATLGVMFSLYCRNSTRAMAATISVSLFVGGGYLFCCVPMMFGPGNDQALVFAPCVPFLLSAPLFFEGGVPHQEGLRVAYLMGLAFYTGGGLLLTVMLADGFDAWVERGRGGGLGLSQGLSPAHGNPPRFNTDVLPAPPQVSLDGPLAARPEGPPQ